MQFRFKTFGKKSKEQNSQKAPKKSSGAFREFLAKLSRALMLPVAMLPIAGLFLGIGSSISSSFDAGTAGNIIGTVIAAPGNAVFSILPLLFAVAIAITFTGDAGTAGLSAVLGWFVFVAFQAALLSSNGKTGINEVQDFHASFLWINYNGKDGYAQFLSSFQSNAGFNSLATGVFGGIVIGMIVQALYNRFKNIVLPTWIAFFQGVRFIPIVTFVSCIGLSLLFSMVWPYVSLGLYYMGLGLSNTYGVNALVFGTVNRMLEPFGLHHVLGTTMWYTPVGGTFNTSNNAIVEYKNTFYYVVDSANKITPMSWYDLVGSSSFTDGQINGDIYIFTGLTNLVGKEVYLLPIGGGTGLSTPVTLDMNMIINGTKCTVDASGHQVFGKITCNPGQYTTGNYLMTMFGLPAAAAAMILAAPKGENRKMSMSILISSMVCSFLTGITEPIEFTFLFLAPWLFYGFHCIMNGLAMMLCYFCSVHLAYSFSASFLDFCIWGIPNEVVGANLNSWVVPCLGIGFAGAYFGVFYFCIKKFDIATPGRGGNTKLFSKKDYLASKEKNAGSSSGELRDNAIEIIKAYGGLKNIKNVDACITKLRIQVANQGAVDSKRLMELGALGVTKPSAQSVYAVFGQLADRYKNEIKAIEKEVGSDKALAAKLAEKAKQVTTSKKKVEPKTKTKLNKKTTSKFKLFSPANGKVINASEIKDDTFAQQIMGKTIGLVPTDGTFKAPFDGKVVMIAPTGHAFGIVDKDGHQLLIHIGIDTVTINSSNKEGEPLKVFKVLKDANSDVKAGEPIIKADLKAIKEKYHLDTTTAIVLLTCEENETLNISFNENKVVKAGQSLIK